MTKSGKISHILLLALFILLDRVSSNCWMEGNSTIAFNHNQRCEAALADERNQTQTFYTTLAAFITALISGSISAISSIIIICLIYRSDIGLSSVYHRIILGMSISDIIASTCMGASTLPMPKDMIYKQFAGWVWGNKTTCTIQGFLIQVFVPLSAFFNALLSLYYVFAINLKKRNAILKKSILFNVVLPVIGIILSSFAPMVVLFAGNMINPTPYEAWCYFDFYPRYCNGMNEELCVPYTVWWEEWILIKIQVIVTVTFNVIQVASLLLVVMDVYRQERYIKMLYKCLYPHRRLGGSGEIKLASTKKRQSYTKVLCIQSAAYIITFILCSANSRAHGGQSPSQGWAIQIYHVSFRPLQGIFNLIIFVGHKAYDNKLMNRSLTVRQAVAQVFQEREKVKFLLSNVSLVRNSQDQAFYFDGEEEEEEERGEEDFSDDVGNHEISSVSVNIRGENEEEGISSAREGEVLSLEDADASNQNSNREDKSTSEKNSQSIGIDSRFSFAESWESRRTRSQGLSALLSLAPSMVSSTGLKGSQDNEKQ